MKALVLSKFLLTLLGLTFLGGGCATERVTSKTEGTEPKPKSVNQIKISESKKSFSIQPDNRETSQTDPFLESATTVQLLDDNQSESAAEKLTKKQKKRIEEQITEEDFSKSIDLNKSEKSKELASDSSNGNKSSVTLKEPENYSEILEVPAEKNDSNQPEYIGEKDPVPNKSDLSENKNLPVEINPEKENIQDVQNFPSNGIENNDHFSKSANNEENDKQNLNFNDKSKTTTEKNINLNSLRPKAEAEQKSSLLAEEQRDETIPLNEKNEARSSLGLKDIFDEDIESSQARDSSVFLSAKPISRDDKQASQDLNLGYKKIHTDKIEQDRTSSQIFFGDGVVEQKNRNDNRHRTLSLSNSSISSLSNRNSTKRLEIGFTDLSSQHPAKSSNDVKQKIGFGDSAFESADKSNDFRVKAPEKNTSKSKEYENVLDFISGGNQSAKSLETNEGARNYNRLRDWGPNVQEINNTQTHRESQPKKYNRAFEWIRQKGRLQKD